MLRSANYASGDPPRAQAQITAAETELATQQQTLAAAGKELDQRTAPTT